MILTRRTMRVHKETAHSRAKRGCNHLKTLVFLCAPTDRYARIESAHSREAHSVQRAEEPQ